jgi:hypothetical protein
MRRRPSPLRSDSMKACQGGFGPRLRSGELALGIL